MKRIIFVSMLAMVTAGCEEPAKVTQEPSSQPQQQAEATGNVTAEAPTTETVTAVTGESETQAAAEQTGDDAQPEKQEMQQVDPSADKPDALGVGHAGGSDPHMALGPDQHVRVALQHRSEGRIAEALVVLDQAVAKYPENAQLYGVRSDIRRHNRDLSGALADMEKAVRLDPEDALYLVGRSQLYLRFERLKEAEADLSRAIELKPELVAARFNRGTLYAHNGDYDKALVDLNACIAADPHLPAPYFNRGSVNYNMGRKEEAVADIERFIELAAGNESWVSSAKDLLKVWGDAEAGKSGDTGAEQKQ